MMTEEKFLSETRQDQHQWVLSYRAEWMSDHQWLCHLFLCRLFEGFHHIPTEPKPHGYGIEINFRPHSLATFDFDILTKLVIMSHNWGVRCDIEGSGPGMVKIILHKRNKREGEIYERHPTITQAVDKYRDY